MIKLYLRLHNAIPDFKKQFLHFGLLAFLMLHIGTNANAQCDVNPVGNQVVCNNTATTAINFTGTATTFTWTNNNSSIGLAVNGTGDIASFTAVNASATAVTAIITVTPSSAACTGSPISFTITVNPSPIDMVTRNTTCGGPCNSMTASGADVYTWTPIAGLFTNCSLGQAYTGTNLATVYTAPTNSSTYTVTGINSATGCIRSAMAIPNYVPAAPVIIPPSVSMCLGDPAVKLRVASGTGSSQFCSGTVNIPVPDNNPAGAFSSINVTGIPATCILQGITVTINMPHSRIGNMVFVLKAPNGAVLNLDYHLGATGGTGPTSGFVNTVISSLGGALLSAGTNPYSGIYNADAQSLPAGGFGANGPTGMLQTITNWAGLAPTTAGANGTWTLGFYDGVTGDVGTLTSWCLGFSYSCPPVAATPATWSPIAGLFANQVATVPHVGNAVDSVWTRPTPAGVYPYQVTVQGLALPLCTATTNFTATNNNSIVTFNVKNNHAYPIKLSQIDSKTFAAGISNVKVFFHTSRINDYPGAISPANGWNQFGFATISGNGISVQPFISNMNLVIPAGATYGICLEAVMIVSNAPNLAYRLLSPGNYSFNDGGCEIITGTDIGYSGDITPAAPTTTPSGFIGAIHFTEPTAGCTSAPTTVVVTVGQAVTVTTQPVNQTVCAGNPASFNVTVTGTGPITYHWQTSQAVGAPWVNIVNGGVFNGVLTNTLSISAATVAMSGYLFRVVVNGGSGCSGATSVAALLTVNTLPDIVLTANPLIIGPTQTTTIFSTITPNPAATYTWYYNNSVLPGQAGSNLVVNYGSPGDYQLKVTDINGCTNLSNIITIANSFALSLFTYPNPNGGLFQVSYNSPANNPVQRSLVIYNNRGEKIITNNFTQTIPYQKIAVDLRANGKGFYWIELSDAAGRRLLLNRVVVQ